MTEYDYGGIREPPPGGDLLNSHVFIIAWDSTGRRYAFGTTPKMLKEKADAERFKTCDLSKYPVGSSTGFANRVVVIQTYATDEKGRARVYRTTADDALREYDGREDFEVLREL